METSVPISHIVALVGDSAYLPCDISTTHEGDSVHLVLWYREDLGTSVYSIDARNREFGIAERWSDDTVFSHRAYFMLDKKPAQLGIENTREEDAGIYRCRVDFQIGQTRNSKVNLTVIECPILIAPGKYVEKYGRYGETFQTKVVGYQGGCLVEKVYKELREIYGKTPKSAPIKYEDLQHMDYLERAIKETMRIFPAVPAIARYLTEDVKM
ncbi:turtle a-like protein, partial [Lasius niger]